MNEFSKFGARPSDDETRVEQTGPSNDETRVESEKNESIEDLVRKFVELTEEYGAAAGKFGGEELHSRVEEEKERLIEESKDFQELFSVLKRIQKLNEINPNFGSIVRKQTEKVTLKIYNITDLIDTINSVRKSRELEEDIKDVTRTAGLRNKVYELIINERKK